MKKNLLLILFLIVVGAKSFAQLADDSFAPNFTLKDINGNTHTLYNYLDSGYTVIIDVSATWCGPCWGFHTSHNLETLYEEHGPGTTDNKIRVLFIEGDVSTTSNDLHGTGSNTQGDWVTGTPYPIIDLVSSNSASIMTAYKIGYFPTVYAICPNRQLFEIGQQTAANLWTNSQNYCGSKIATKNNDPSIVAYTGNTNDCKTPTIKVKLQNMGKDTLTATTLTAEPEGLTPIVYNWTGKLAPYSFADIILGTVQITADTKLNVNITSADENAANNTISTVLNYAKLSGSKNAIIKVATDRNGAQTTWKLTSNGITIKSGGPYANETTPGTYVREELNVALPFNSCYKLEVFDSGNNGMKGANGTGYVKIEDANGQELINISEFTDVANGIFKKDATSAINDIENSVANIYPNPSNSIFIVTSTQHDLKMSVENMMGQNLNCQTIGYEGTYTIDLSNYPAGTYCLKVSNGSIIESHKLVLVK